MARRTSRSAGSGKTSILMHNKQDKKALNTCDECGSQYDATTSPMASLCPHCSHLLYDYPNCAHEFDKGRCIKCFWDGTTTHFCSGNQS